MKRFPIILLLASPFVFLGLGLTNSFAGTITWQSTGSLNAARQNQTATLLGNGQVLVVGGKGRSGDPDFAELYNPVTGEWSETPSLGYSIQFGHTATLL